MIHMNKKIQNSFIFFFFVFCLTNYSAAQNTLNFGLNERQQLMPVSRVPIQKPQLRASSKQQTVLQRVNDFEYLISGGWKLKEAYKMNEAQWYDAVVPGTVLTSLVDMGIYPSPLFGLNNMCIPDTLCRMDWIYKNNFVLPKSFEGKQLKVLFNGINYEAEIYLNNIYLGNMRGAFTRGIFDITHMASFGKNNELKVVIHPPHNPGIPQEANSESHGPNGGILCLDGPTFICSEGWDWIPGIRDRNIGIWQDVRLQVMDGMEIADPQIVTDLPLPDTSYVNISIRAKIENHLSVSESAQLRLEIPHCMDASIPVNLLPHEQKTLALDHSVIPALKMTSPLLWWPNGYGKQNLYTLKMSLYSSSNHQKLYEKSIQFGVREMEYILSACKKDSAVVRVLYNPLLAKGNTETTFDINKRVKVKDDMYLPMLQNENGITYTSESQAAPYIIVKVNGVKIFCRGGNWGMDDAMKRVSEERLEPYFKLQKEQNFNMIRNWTGESTEEAFYDLCDKYGLLVLNDFWMSTENYNLVPTDMDLFLNNVRETVIRYRNHPSIALWCPRNEGFAPQSFEKGISSILQTEDGTRYYLGNSRIMNTTKSGPWDYRNPAFYYSFAKGFDTEVGTPSIPLAKTIRKMMAKEDTWPIGDAWYYHDYLMGLWGTHPFIEGYKNAIDTLYGKSNTLDEFCTKAQMVNFVSHRAIFEAWNSKMWNNTSGVLLWMGHPAWPSMVWQTYSYDCESTGAYYGVKKACKPLHLQMNLASRQIDLINSSNRDYHYLSVKAFIYNNKGKLVHKMSHDAKNIRHDTCEHLFVLDDNSVDRDNNTYFVKLELYDKTRLMDDNYYWINGKGKKDYRDLNEIPKVNLDAKVIEFHKNGINCSGKILISNHSSDVAFGIWVSEKNILPAFFADGYFFVMPGNKKYVDFKFCDKTNRNSYHFMIDGYNVQEKEILGEDGK
jgi:hypothetical protein